MPGQTKRTKAGFRLFYQYAEEAHLLEPLQDIAKHHGTTLFDVYADAKGREATAARIESWHWLISQTARSTSEVAELFDRNHHSVAYAMRQLRKRAEQLTVRVALDTVPTLAKLVANDVAPDARRAIKRA